MRVFVVFLTLLTGCAPKAAPIQFQEYRPIAPQVKPVPVPTKPGREQKLEAVRDQVRQLRDDLAKPSDQTEKGK